VFETEAPGRGGKGHTPGLTSWSSVWVGQLCPRGWGLTTRSLCRWCNSCPRGWGHHCKYMTVLGRASLSSVLHRTTHRGILDPADCAVAKDVRVSGLINNDEPLSTTSPSLSGPCPRLPSAWQPHHRPSLRSTRLPRIGHCFPHQRLRRVDCSRASRAWGGDAHSPGLDLARSAHAPGGGDSLVWLPPHPPRSQ
jgi:hypothetical protein